MPGAYGQNDRLSVGDPFAQRIRGGGTFRDTGQCGTHVPGGEGTDHSFRGGAGCGEYAVRSGKPSQYALCDAESRFGRSSRVKIAQENFDSGIIPLYRDEERFLYPFGKGIVDLVAEGDDAAFAL